MRIESKPRHMFGQPPRRRSRGLWDKAAPIRRPEEPIFADYVRAMASRDAGGREVAPVADPGGYYDDVALSYPESLGSLALSITERPSETAAPTIGDWEAAESLSERTQAQILKNAETAMLAQANFAPPAVLTLLI